MTLAFDYLTGLVSGAATIRRGRAEPLVINLLARGAQVTLGETGAIKLTLKLKTDLDAETPLFSKTLTAADLHEGSGTYRNVCDLFTAGINSLLGVGAGDDLAEAEVYADCQFLESDSAEWIPSDLFTLTVKNTAGREDDETPEPLASRNIVYKPLLVGLTGGGATKLDGLTTLALAAGYALALFDDSASSVLRVYELVAGTDAESSPDVIRGDDYNASTNAKVWKLRNAAGVATSRTINAAGLATGGGDLSADRVITVAAASQAEAEAGSNNANAMTPLRTAQAIAALGVVGSYTYIVEQNAAGTVYTARDDSGAIVTSSSAPDIVPVLNTLLANLVTAGKGGKIFIKAGSYIATDAGGWTDDPNDNTGGAAYLIGVPIVSSSAQFMPITIEGEGLGAWGAIYTRFDLGGAGALNTVGTQIKCVLSNTTLPNKHCSLFRVLTDTVASGHFYRLNFVRMIIGGIRFTAGTTNLTSGGGNCQWSTVHCGYASGLTINGGLLCDVQHANTSHSDSGVYFSLGGVTSTGLVSPNGGNQACMSMDYLQCVSYNIGARLYDHTQLQLCYMQNCQYGVKLGSGTDHVVVLEHYLFQQCNHAISFDSPGRTVFEIRCLDAEPPDNLVDPQGRNFWGLIHSPNDGPVTGSINIVWGTDGFRTWNANGNTIGLGTLPGGIGTASEDSNLKISLIGDFGFSITGTTAGKIRWTQPEMGTNYKKVIATLQGYDNNSGVAQYFDFIVPFLLTPTITSQPAGFGATVSTTRLTLPTAIGAAVDGVIVIEGR